MKKIYTLFILLNVLVMSNLNAQFPFCNINYNFSNIPYNPNPFNVGTDVIFPTTDTSMSDLIPIGFIFNFYGNNYSEIVASPNGFFTFDNTMADYHPVWVPTTDMYDLPTSQYPVNSIFLFYGYEQIEMINGTTTLKYVTTGTAPNRLFTLSFDSLFIQSINWTYHDSSWYINAQLILYESTNNIETHISYEPYADQSNNQNTSLIVGVQNNSGTLATTDINRFGDVINYANRYTPFNAPMAPLSICLVSVDSSTDKNMVIWNQPTGIPVDSFIIYRETNQSGVYSQIGVQSANIYSTFIDTGSYPAVQANRYKLGFRDSCGTIALQSDEQKTIHLSVNQGQNNSWNLIWDAFEGINFSSYNIYRGTSQSNMTLLTTIASTLYQYSDLTPPSNVYYAIGIVDTTGCNPSARMESNFGSSISNIVNPTSLGINIVQESNDISIYPNPATNILTIHSQLPITNTKLYINDILGNTVYQQNVIANDNSIDVSKWSKGIYILQIKNEKESLEKKLIVQ